MVYAVIHCIVSTNSQEAPTINQQTRSSSAQSRRSSRLNPLEQQRHRNIAASPSGDNQDSSVVAAMVQASAIPARPRPNQAFSYASGSYRIRSYAPLLRRRAIFKVA
ncbi:MAG: hypothetical protein WCZ02_07255 [Lysobacterales bacterium]